MKLPVFLRISLKYLWRYRRRYLFLFLALGFGFGVVTVISSLKDGMKENLYLSARSHYAGDIVALGYNPDLGIKHHLDRDQIDAIFASAGAAGINTAGAAIRTTLTGMKEGTIYFNGNAVALKYVVGVDWEREASYFKDLSYTESPDPPQADSIFLSAPIAQELGARQGDGIILETLTVTGEKNTGPFVIAGVVEDTSFFSYYKVYVSRPALNRLIGFAGEDCSLIGFYLRNKTAPSSSFVDAKRRALYQDLAERIHTGPLVYDRDAFDQETDKAGGGGTVFLVTLPVYLSEVAELLEAIDLASYVLYGMMLAIIMVSAGVTCRLILHERSRETGTMRTIGFYDADLRIILQLELCMAALSSMAAGFILALFINQILSYTSFKWFPGFEVFMQNGRITALYVPETIALNVAAVLAMLILAVWGPIFRNSRSSLPEMLSGGIL
ncbi:MAG: ABC transporter permease [Spirochaetaceae bacterium]|jgi:ABC-type lipoprotein release transport system permease subunit|nr:ABC transporter permease [Spirochaetaceae bacterium]